VTARIFVYSDIIITVFLYYKTVADDNDELECIGYQLNNMLHTVQFACLPHHTNGRTYATVASVDKPPSVVCL